jgi:rubrerythrin
VAGSTLALNVMEWPSFKEEVFAGNWVDAELVNNLLVTEGIPTIVTAAKQMHQELLGNVHCVYVLDRNSCERAKEIVDRVRRGETLKAPKTYRAWRCKQCNELIEGQFETCWKCGNPKSATTA